MMELQEKKESSKKRERERGIVCGRIEEAIEV
jgi:hypothetical protein